MPFSVEETFTLALMLQKSCGASTTGCGRSTSFRSPNVASSNVQFCSVSSKNGGKEMMMRMGNMRCVAFSTYLSGSQ